MWTVVCFVTAIPLERLFDWAGEQMALYLGQDLGDLLSITLSKYVFPPNGHLTHTNVYKLDGG